MKCHHPRIREFVGLVLSNDFSYNSELKQVFHHEAEWVLKRLAKFLGLHKFDYDLRHLYAGVAVSGDITLHSDYLYIQFSASSTKELGFLWRTCKFRGDYSGGPNQWVPWMQLCDLSALSEQMLHRVAVQHARLTANSPTSPF